MQKLGVLPNVLYILHGSEIRGLRKITLPLELVVLCQICSPPLIQFQEGVSRAVRLAAPGRLRERPFLYRNMIVNPILL